MDMLKGKRVITKDGMSYKANHYLRKAKIIIYYFSASWVDDTNLLKKLKTIYAENQKREMNMEVIYVSSDTEEKLFTKSFRDQHGPWAAIAIKNVALAEVLRHRYNVTCLPQIIVVQTDDGSIITRRGKEELEKNGINVLVTWSDYQPNLILIDDNLIDLNQDVAAKPEDPPHEDRPKVDKESKPPQEDDFDVDFAQLQSKVLSFGNRKK